MNTDVSAGRRLFAGMTAFVVAVFAVRAFRPAVLFGPELPFLVPWLGMWVLALGATAATAFLADRAFALFAKTRAADASLPALPFGRGTLVLVSLGAVVAGTWFRFASLAGRPPSSLADDLTLLGETLDLTGGLSDFVRPLRAAPFGIEKPFATVGVLYLELSRLSLKLFGTTLTGIRVPAALAGALSVVTGALVGRALLPKGGGTLVALVLAGFRWPLVVARCSWAVSIVVAPLVDVATLLLVPARRRGKPLLALAAGLVLGLGAHAYLAAWVAGAALAAWAALPGSERERPRAGLARAAAFAAGFALAAAPLLRPSPAGDPPYFARAGTHNVVKEMGYQKSWLPPFGAAADALAAPWFVPDPAPWGDLPGRSRLGLLLGTGLAVALLRALLAPRAELSGLLLAHAAAALVSAVAQGESGNPNGYRYVYLAGPAALGAVAGLLALLACVPARAFRPAAGALVGAVAIVSVLGARDACLVWPESRTTFAFFRGCGTLLGEAAHRWGRYGPAEIAPGKSDTLEIARLVARWGLVRGPEPEPGGTLHRPSSFRVVPAGPTEARGGRVLERVVTPWNEPCGAVLLEPSVQNSGRGRNAP